jgi:hypothetical protein
LPTRIFPALRVDALVRAGHDVAWIAKIAPGDTRFRGLQVGCTREPRYFAFDKDFGDLARGANLPAACGVVLFRLPMPPSAEVGARLANLIGNRPDWLGHFSVIEPDRVRMRLLPK